MNKYYNYIWIGILLLSIIGAIFLIKLAYANPLELPNYAFTKPKNKRGVFVRKVR